MKKNFILTLLGFSLFLLTNCSTPPCGGKGNIVDTGPFPSGWNQANTIPAGGTLCKPDEEGGLGKYTKRVEYVGLTPHETIKKFQKLLTVSGWKQLEYKLTDEAFWILKMEKGGNILDVIVSKRVKNKGWATVTFTASSSS